MLDRMQSLKASEVMPRDAEWFIDGHIALGYGATIWVRRAAAIRMGCGGR